MAIRARWGGVWKGPIADGDVKVKWGGTTWRTAAFVRIKRGAVGGGYWTDSGYRGYPNEPSGVSVNTWDNTAFNDITIKWNAPAAGGAPVASYEIAMNNSAGTRLATLTDTASPSSAFTVVPDGKYAFYVRAKSSAGLFSDWAGPVKVLMGHTEAGHNETENRTRNWYREINGNWYKDAYSGGDTVLKVPSDVVVKKLHYDVRANQGFTSILSPYGNRDIYLVVKGNDYGAPKNMGNPYVTVEGGWSTKGNDADPWWGLRCRGTGWSIFPDGLQRMVGTFGVEGTETYQVTVYVVDRAYKANSYW